MSNLQLRNQNQSAIGVNSAFDKKEQFHLEGGKTKI